MTTNDLDAMFGFKWATIGDVEEGETPRRLKLRVMLTRKQARIVRNATRDLAELQVNLNQMLHSLKDLDSTKPEDKARLDAATAEAEAGEDRVADSMYHALDALVADLPPEYAELSMHALSSLFRQITVRQAKELETYVQVETGHPTLASNGS